MDDPLRDATRRLLRNSLADGLSEITVGLILISLPFLEWCKSLFEPNSTAWCVLVIAQILPLFPGILLAQWGLPRLRHRLFGNRSGIAFPRMAPEGKAKAGAAAGVAAMTALVFALMARGASAVPFAILAAGFLSAILLVHIGRMAGVWRLQAMGAATALTSIVVAVQVNEISAAFLWLWGIVGGLCLGAGLATLAHYLHAPPRVAQ